MQSRLLLAALFSATITGCVISTDHPSSQQPQQGQSGNVDLIWSFSDGSSCSSQIDHIQVTIAGQVLAQGGKFGCSLDGVQGIELEDFTPGTYSFTVDADDANNNVLDTASGTFTVDGDIDVPVTLNPQTTPGNITVLWTFPQAASCATAGVDHVQISVGSETLPDAGTFGCTNNGSQGIELTDFIGGSYPVSITAYDVNGNALFSGSGTAVVNGDVQVTIALTSVASSATLQLNWSFLDANASPQNCANAGVVNVKVTLGTQTPFTVACTSNGVDGTQLSPVAAGSYDVNLQGLDASGNAVYGLGQQIQVTAPSTTVSVQLTALSGSWDLSYNFANSASCAAAGVSQVSLSVKDSNGNEISGIAPGTLYPCADSPTNVFTYASFPGGDVAIQMLGYATSSSTSPIWGASRSATILNGANNDSTVTLDTCGSSGAGC